MWNVNRRWLRGDVGQPQRICVEEEGRGASHCSTEKWRDNSQGRWIIWDPLQRWDVILCSLPMGMGRRLETICLDMRNRGQTVDHSLVHNPTDSPNGSKAGLPLSGSWSLGGEMTVAWSMYGPRSTWSWASNGSRSDRGVSKPDMVDYRNNLNSFVELERKVLINFLAACSVCRSEKRRRGRVMYIFETKASREGNVGRRWWDGRSGTRARWMRLTPYNRDCPKFLYWFVYTYTLWQRCWARLWHPLFLSSFIFL